MQALWLAPEWAQFASRCNERTAWRTGRRLHAYLTWVCPPLAPAWLAWSRRARADHDVSRWRASLSSANPSASTAHREQQSGHAAAARRRKEPRSPLQSGAAGTAFEAFQPSPAALARQLDAPWPCGRCD